MLQQEILKKPSIDRRLIPHHVAIIMDGNRRWAYQKMKAASFGHQTGANVVERIVKRATELEISVLTLFTFSTENWKRSRTEIEILFLIFENHLNKMKDAMQKEGIRFKTIGNLDPLPRGLRNLIEKVSDSTKEGKKLELVLAVNYGARDEILRAVKKLIIDCKNKQLDPQMIDEAFFANYLDTKDFIDPDLIIRTGGENRLSNFLLWQSAYSEFYTTDTYWPDFTAEDLDSAIIEYSRRQRRKGM